MKYDTVTFSCDAPDCRTLQTVPSGGGPIQPYLVLVDAGWYVEHPLLKGWSYYCPEHAQVHRPEVKP